MLARSCFIESSPKLLVTRTGIKAQSSSILGRIRPLILELLALEWRKFHTFELEYGWWLKPEILAQGWPNVNERHHGYNWSLVHTHQLQGRWHLICPFFVSVQGQRSVSAFLHKMTESSLSYANKHCFT